MTLLSPRPQLPPGVPPTVREQIAQLFAALRVTIERVDGLNQATQELLARVEQLQREARAARGSKQRTARKGSPNQ